MTTSSCSDLDGSWWKRLEGNTRRETYTRCVFYRFFFFLEYIYIYINIYIYMHTHIFIYIYIYKHLKNIDTHSMELGTRLYYYFTMTCVSL